MNTHLLRHSLKVQHGELRENGDNAGAEVLLHHDGVVDQAEIRYTVRKSATPVQRCFQSFRCSSSPKSAIRLFDSRCQGTVDGSAQKEE